MNNRDHIRSKKTPEKAHLDTLRRRERRQRTRTGSFENTSEELGRLNDNRFALLSETDEEISDIDDQSEADKAMKNKRQQHKNLS
jgi:hypothetical protein